jgi:hydroxyacylglutathione hydrolase
MKDRLGDDVTIHASGMGGEFWTPPYADHVVQNGDEIVMGSVRLKALHTPGHTLEHVSWELYDSSRSQDTPWLVFTGDFAFVGDVGRPDLLGEEARKELAHQLYGSVFTTLPPLPDFTEIFPGHGAGSLCGKAIGSRASSTLGYERRFNAALKEKPEEEWITDLMHQMPLSPPYFARMKRINREGPPVIGTELPGQRRWSAKEIHQRVCEHCLIVDVRSKEAFAATHIPGAINIPAGPTLATWAGWVLPYDRPTLIVVDNPNQMPEVTTQLLRVGFDDIQGYLEGGMDAWQNSGYEIGTLPMTSVHALSKQLDEVTVLDARTEKEWNAGHVEGAIHIHGGTLQSNFELVPRDKPVVVICGSGYRGSIAASFLKREGYENVSNVPGGMSAWKSAGLPFVTSESDDSTQCRASATAAACS